MPTPAMALALLLHALMALAFWWLGVQATRPEHPETPVEVTIERPPPEPPKPPQPEPPKPEARPEPAPPSPPLVEALAPPGETSDRRGQIPGSREQPKTVENAEPAPQTALATPQPEPRPEPPRLEPPRPDPPRAEPPRPEPPQPQPPRPEPPKPQATHPPEHKPAPQAAVPAPRPQQRPPPPPAHSPLVARPRAPPPVANPGQSTTSPFVNPADTYNRSLARDNYLWEVVRRLAGYRYNANVNVSQGVTVVRVVIARDGRLLDVSVLRSSGYPELDAGVIAGIRQGAPYSPLPAEVRGTSASFDLPLVSVHR